MVWVPSGRVALQPVSAMTAAAQEPLANELRAATTAPVAVRDRSPGPILRDSCVARDSPASRAPADHPAAVGVNPDASLFCRAPGSDVPARHGARRPRRLVW